MYSLNVQSEYVPKWVLPTVISLLPITSSWIRSMFRWGQAIKNSDHDKCLRGEEMFILKISAHPPIAEEEDSARGQRLLSIWMSPRTFALTTIQHSTPWCLRMPITFQYSSNVIRYFIPFWIHFFLFFLFRPFDLKCISYHKNPLGNIALITELLALFPRWWPQVTKRFF